MQKNGWMTDSIGERWFEEVFIAQCGDQRPQLLVLDGHSLGLKGYIPQARNPLCILLFVKAISQEDDNKPGKDHLFTECRAFSARNSEQTVFCAWI
jgi:hypothetical protein